MTLRPILFQIPAPYSDNPWVRQHIAREAALQDDVSSEVWGPDVIAEYHGHEKPLGSCPCGGQLWYWARTGGHKCPDCRAYADSHGTVIGIETVKEDEHV